MNEVKYRKLRRFNLAAGVLHAVQGLIMLLLAGNFSVWLTTDFLKAGAGPPVHQLNNVVQLPLGPLIALFMFMSAFAHFSVSTYGYKWYVDKISKGMNPARWYEYTVSSSLMIVIIALLSGFTDVAAMVLLVAANGSMNLFGLMMELQNQTTKKTDWTAFWLGSFAGIMAWIAVLIYFIGAAIDASGNIPSFVYVAVATLIVFWFSFPINMILQYRKKGRYADYLFGERGYIILSLVSKSLLAWIIFFGIQARV